MASKFQMHLNAIDRTPNPTETGLLETRSRMARNRKRNYVKKGL